MLEASLESGRLAAARELCGDFLGALEDADGERDGRDRGAYRFLKAVTVLLRLKGFNSRDPGRNPQDQMMPITDIELNGHPLLAFTSPTRAAGTPPGKPEPTVRALELAVHLARSSNKVSAIRLVGCELSPDGGDKCMTEVVRLVRQVGIGSQARFLDEVDLRGNSMDAEAVRKIVEAAVKERCERPRACAGSPPLWLDLSGNRVRNPGTVFQNLQAWAVWAHGREQALCLADKDGCSRKACPSKCMLHMPGFLEQCKAEAKQAQPLALAAPESADAAPAAPPPLLPAPLPLRPSPARKRAPEAWRPLASPNTRRRDPSRRPRREASTQRDRRRRGSRGRRRRPSKEPRAEVQLKPRPGFVPGAEARAAASSRSRTRRGRSRSRRRKQEPAKKAGRSSASSASASVASEADDSASSCPGSGAADSARSASGSEAAWMGGRASGGPSLQDEEGEEEEPVAGSCSPSRSLASGSGGSVYSYSCSEEEAAPHRADAGGGPPPSTEQLGLRINRLIESLKSSAADGVAQEPRGGRRRRR